MLISKAIAVVALAVVLAEGAAPKTTPKSQPTASLRKSAPAATKPVPATPTPPQRAAPASLPAPLHAAARPTSVTTKMASIPTALQLHSVEAAVVEQTNRERARHGLPPLVVDQRLVQSARAHTAWMSRSRRLQHTSRPVAENIAMGQRSAGEAVQSWMNSSGHRANILSRGHGRIGVSAYSAPDGTVYWTQQFEP